DGRGSGQGPLLLVPPDVVSHDEEPHRWLVPDAVVCALEPAVEPAQEHAFEIYSQGVRPQAEVVVPGDPRASGASVLPGADEQLLAPPGLLGRALLPHTQVVAQGAAQEDIVPAANVQGRDGDAGVILLDGQVLPVVIVVGA